MKLSKEDGQLFYKLWVPLLDYVNQKFNVNENMPQMVGAEGLDPNEVMEIAEVLWENVAVIDEYLAEHTEDMSEEDRAIVVSWKRRVKGTFVLERHLKKGSIFISEDDGKVYQVNGITTTWEDMFWFRPTPIMMEATFIPFKDVIITDGLVFSYNIVIGRNMEKYYKDKYLAAKKNGELYKKL